MIRRIVGTSMLPALMPGDIVVAVRRQPRPGDIVIAKIGQLEVIKRVTQVLPDGSVYLLGDNPAHSTDSRTLGVFNKSDILGITIMKLHFAHTTDAPAPLRRNLVWLPYGLALLTMIMLLSQLFTFEKFVPLFGTYFLPGGEIVTKLVAGLLVVGELFALPFWLQMRLSPLARLASFYSGLFFISLWLLLNVWTLGSVLIVDNVGYFGSLIPQPNGWVSLLQGLLLLGAAVAAGYVLNVPQVIKEARR